jgi:hypothetical protein
VAAQQTELKLKLCYTLVVQVAAVPQAVETTTVQAANKPSANVEQALVPNHSRVLPSFSADKLSRLALVQSMQQQWVGGP